MKILVLNGPNINLLGVREPEIYGKENYSTLLTRVQEHANLRGVTIRVVQTNHEGVLVDEIQSAYSKYQGIVINPAAYTHTSIAILDAVKAVGIPTVEVHISDVSKREDFRQISYIRAACIATIAGHGIQGYLEAIDLLIAHHEKKA
jgi:3-dehydroquinate dehydratase-2